MPLWAWYSGTAVPQLLAGQATAPSRYVSTTHLTFPECHMSRTDGRANLCTCRQLNTSQKHCLCCRHSDKPVPTLLSTKAIRRMMLSWWYQRIQELLGFFIETTHERRFFSGNQANCQLSWGPGSLSSPTERTHTWPPDTEKTIVKHRWGCRASAARALTGPALKSSSLPALKGSLNRQQGPSQKP